MSTAAGGERAIATRRSVLTELFVSAARLDRTQSDPVVSARNALGVALPLAIGALLGSAAFGLPSTIGALQTAFILRMALFESVALYGFVLGFLGTPLRTTLIFFVVAWLAMIAQFPSQGRDDAAITRATGIRFP